jgi:hypothetical protein
MDARAVPSPLAERRAGPFVLRLLPAAHPTADLEKALAIVGLVGLAALVVLPLGALAPLGMPCRFRSLTGIPCPTCGGTRALLALAGLDVARAFVLNPLVTAGVLGVLTTAPLAAAAWAFGWPRPRVGLRSARARLGAVAVGVVLFLLHWGYLVAAGR